MTDEFCRHKLENHDFNEETHRYFAHVRTNKWTLKQICNFFASKDGYGSYEQFMKSTNGAYYANMKAKWASFCTRVKAEKDAQVESEKVITKVIEDLEAKPAAVTGAAKTTEKEVASRNLSK